MTFTFRDPTPVDVIVAIRNYCQGNGDLYKIAQALDVPWESFKASMTWYLNQWTFAHDAEPPGPSDVLAIVLLHMASAARRELADLTNRLSASGSDYPKKRSPALA